MAKDKGIKRFVQLLLDKASAKRVQRGIKDALDKGTDPKKPLDNQKKIAAGFRGIAAAAKLAGAAIIAAFSVRALIRFGKQIAELTKRGGKFNDVQAAFARLTGDSANAIALLKSATKGLISEYDLMVQFNRSLALGAVENVKEFANMAQTAETLGRALGLNVLDAMDRLNIAMARGSKLRADDVGLNIDLTKANNAYAAQLGKSTAALTDSERKQAFLNEINEEAERLTKKLGTAVEDNADKLQRLGVMWKDTVDQIGVFLAESPEVADALDDMATELERNAEALKSIALFGIQAIGVLVKFGALAVRVATGLAIGRFVPAFGPPRGLRAPFDSDPTHKHPGSLSDLRKFLEGPQTPGAPEDEREIPEGVRIRERPSIERRVRGIGDFPQFEGAGDFEQMLPILTPDAFEDQEEMIQRLADTWLDANMRIEFAAQTAALGIARAWKDAFSLLLAGFDNIGTAAATLAKGMGAAFLEGLASFAGGKIAENIARGFEMLALAANPFNLPLAPALVASAKGHFFAAAKWAVLAGGAAAAAGSLRGGGRAGGGDIGSGGSRDATNLQGRGPITAPIVNIYIDPLDPASPVYQRNLAVASRYARERFGGQAIVNVRPRSGADSR